MGYKWRKALPPRKLDPRGDLMFKNSLCAFTESWPAETTRLLGYDIVEAICDGVSISLSHVKLCRN